jgi:exo-beta-1,3-glucanase (GH17 family)
MIALALPGATAASGLRPVREEPFMLRAFRSAGDDHLSLNAVCYGPHRDGQRPGEAEPSAAQLSEDLRLLARHWQRVRIYGSSGSAETLLTLIRDENWKLQVMLGVWISANDTTANRREIEAAVRLTAAFPGIVTSVSVGNETQISWSGHRCAPELLIDAVREVRARTAVPVTTADDFNFWNKPESRAVAAELDFITLHAHPLWNGQQLNEALPWLREQLAAVVALHADRTVVIGETGWATARHTEGEQATLIKGRVGEAEQKIFHDAVRAWAVEEDLTVYFFEAFDENWKGGAHPDEVEKHWGLMKADRSPKAALLAED